MATSLSSLWLKNMRRISKAQQAQGRRLFKSLVPKASKAPAVGKSARPSLKSATPAKPVKRARPKAKAATPVRKPLVVPVQGVSSLPGSWQKSSFSFPGEGQLAPTRRMQYWLYLPSAPAGAPVAARPLVVMLHGCQQTAPDFATATRMNALAERKGFAVLYPQQSAAADSHRCWHWYKRSTQQGLGDVRLVAALMAQVQRKHGLDASRTYVAGLSAGAALATLVALRYPDMVAAVGLHSAPVFGTSDSPLSAYHAMQHGSALTHSETARAFASVLPGFPGMPAIVIHGERDAVVRRINAEQLARQFAIINAPLITSEQPTRRSYPARAGGRSPRHAYQTATCYAGRKPLLVSCDIARLGHAWSGGEASLPFSASEGPDATLMMWTFFAHHRRVPARYKINSCLRLSLLGQSPVLLLALP